MLVLYFFAVLIGPPLGLQIAFLGLKMEKMKRECGASIFQESSLKSLANGGFFGSVCSVIFHQKTCSTEYCHRLKIP